MGDNLKYIYDYLNRKSSTLSFYVSRINQIYNQKSQNGLELASYVERITELINEIKVVMKKMNINQVPVNDFCNQLKLLDKYGIPEVIAFLDNNNYGKVISDSVDRTIHIIDEDALIPEEDLLVINFLINNHIVPKEYQEKIYEYFIRRSLLKQKIVPYETFENIILDWTKMQMSMYLDDYECFIMDENELQEKLGYAFQTSIYLNKSDVQAMYNTGFFRLIKTIYHELVHIMQYKLVMIDGKSTDLLLKEIKDEILSYLIPEYYKENYERLSYEAEAEFLSIYSMLKLFEKFGIQFSKGINPYIDTLEKLEQIINSEERLIDGEVISLSELFEYEITNYPEFLEKYPQLKEGFHIAFGDLVVSNDDFGSR